ncbi:MAG: hypothetical protein JW716_00035 [Candidatus Aenigmarchaeota archaeon]|nr:hypothetical protein [Candidatus Aenigmarchaeota archaeon]
MECDLAVKDDRKPLVRVTRSVYDKIRSVETDYRLLSTKTTKDKNANWGDPVYGEWSIY